MYKIKNQTRNKNTKTICLKTIEKQSKQKEKQ